MSTLKHLFKKPFLFLSVVLLIAACSKTGPEGPQGTQGTSGPAGAQGPAGAAGSTGSANVIYSDWFTPQSYSVTSTTGINDFYYDKSATGITQDILDKGVILTYGKLNGYGPSVWPINQVAELPITFVYKFLGVERIDTWSAYATLGNLRINYTNGAYYDGFFTTDSHTFRYIIIPGGVSGNRMSGPPPDHSDYNAVCKYYGIPENKN